MLYGCETWPAKLEDGQRLHRNEKDTMERDSCNLLRKRLGVTLIVDLMRCSRLSWFGHIVRQEESSWFRQVQDWRYQVTVSLVVPQSPGIRRTPQS